MSTVITGLACLVVGIALGVAGCMVWAFMAMKASL